MWRMTLEAFLSHDLDNKFVQTVILPKMKRDH